MEKECVEATRRKLLGTVGGAIGGGSVVTTGASAAGDCGIPQSGGDFTERDYEWEISGSDAHVGACGWDRCAQEVRASLLYLGSEYIHTRGYWEHFFTAASIVTAARKGYGEPESGYERDENTVGHQLTIENLRRHSTGITAIDTPDFVGAYPQGSGGDATTGSFGNTAFTVFASAASVASGGTVIPVALSAASIVGAIGNAGERKYDSDDVEFSWDYSDNDVTPCTAANYCRFSVKCNPGESKAAIKTTHRGAKETGGNFATVRFWNSVDAEPSEEPTWRFDTDDTAAGTPTSEPGTPAYRRYLENSPHFERVQPAQSLDTRVREMESPGPIYIARNPTIRGGQLGGIL